VVATASYEARKFGVHSAMPLRTATRLLPADAVYLRGDYKEYLRVSRAFHGILADCTPLLESGGLDEAYLDITGCEALIGTPEQAAATIRARIPGPTTPNLTPLPA
jgi:DNA polymerase-4